MKHCAMKHCTMKHCTIKQGICSVLLLLALSVSTAQANDAIDISGFEDIIKHWNDQNADDTAPLWPETNIAAIADNLLIYQRADGGWPVNRNPLRKLTSAEIKAEQAQHNAQDSSFDNRNTYPQIRYLAAAFRKTNNSLYRDAARRGLSFIIDTQLPNGGWTHTPARTDDYFGHITIMDAVMPGILTLLREINEGDPNFIFLTKQERHAAKIAQNRGDQLLLQLQIKQNGIPTIWAGQYTRDKVQPTTGRAFELPGLVARESVEVVQYLMGFKNPNKATINAIENAITWFKENAIQGLRYQEIAAKAERFDFHGSASDFIVTPDAQAPLLWARFYDLADNTPFFANRDGTRVATLSEVARERRTGYSWYGYWPSQLIEQDYREWKKSIDQ